MSNRRLRAASGLSDREYRREVDKLARMSAVDSRDDDRDAETRGPQE